MEKNKPHATLTFQDNFTGESIIVDVLEDGKQVELGVKTSTSDPQKIGRAAGMCFQAFMAAMSKPELFMADPEQFKEVIEEAQIKEDDNSTIGEDS